MSNVLDDAEQHQIRTLGRLGWTLSRIQAATGTRRETISRYLKAAGIPVRRRGRPSEATANAAIKEEVSTDSPPPSNGVTPAAATPRPGRAPSASACEPYRELIVDALGRGRNAVAIWQDLVDDHGFTGRYASVRRFVRSLRRTAPPDWVRSVRTGPRNSHRAKSLIVRRLHDRCQGATSLLPRTGRDGGGLDPGSSIGDCDVTVT